MSAVRVIGSVVKVFPSESSTLRANDGDTCGCSDPLWGVIYLLRVRALVDTLDCLGLDGGAAMNCHPLAGIVVVPRYLSTLCRGPRLQVRFSFVLFCLSFICFVKGFPHHRVSARPFGLFIKRGVSMFRGNLSFFAQLNLWNISHWFFAHR